MAPHVKSKRVTLKHKYKVERKVREHHRAVRRQERKNKRNNAISKKRMKKDPGIPNLYPYKQELMEKLEQKRIAAEEAKKALIAAKRQALLAERNKAGPSNLQEFSANAAARTANFDEGEDFHLGEMPVVDAEELSGGKKLNSEEDQSRRAFMREFRKVVDSADVILEVLDARDPIGCRCFDAERAVIASTGGTKRIVLVLNKVDLVPREVTDKWLAYLRNEFPTVAFRASTQSSGKIGQAAVTALAAASVNTTECLGANNLLSLLKNYARNQNLKTAITVGVIGFPNVGKSSLINSLKRSRAVSTGAIPGLTRSAQEVHLDKNIRLIDCPGIVFSPSNQEALVLRNCIKIENLADPISPVETIIKRVGAEPLMVAYSLPAFNTTAEFLALLCKMRGKVKRGGAFDVEASAKLVLKDWNSGKIPFYTLPPKGPQSAQLSASIVQSWGEEFDVKNVMECETRDLEAVKHDARSLTLFAPAAEVSTPGNNHGVEIEVSDDTGHGSEMRNKANDKLDTNEPSYHVAQKAPTSKDNPESSKRTKGKQVQFASEKECMEL